MSAEPRHNNHTNKTDAMKMTRETFYKGSKARTYVIDSDVAARTCAAEDTEKMVTAGERL